MSKTLITFAAGALVLLAGAGCLGLGGKGTSTTVAAGGVWVSDDGGEDWTAKSALPTATEVSSINGLDVLSFEQDPSDASVWYAGTKTSGLFYSLDGGNIWQRPEDKDVTTGAVLDVQVDPKNVCTHYVLKADRLLKTINCGRTYNRETYVSARAEEQLTTLAIDWYAPNTLWVGTTKGDVLRSTDAGATWAAVHRSGDTITDITVSNADSRIILLGSSRHGVTRSVDGGTTWVADEDQFKQFKKSTNVYDLDQSSSGSVVLASSEYGILQSTDNGATWTSVPLVTDEGDVVVRAMAVSPTDDQIFYYATSSTFYRSTSGGSAWSTNSLPTSRAAAVIRPDVTNGDHIFLGAVTLEK